MAPQLLLIPSVMACLVLTLITAAQTDMIIPVPSITTMPSLNTLVAAIPAVSDTSSMAINPPSTTIAAQTSPTPVLGDDNYVLVGCFNEPPASSSSRALGVTGTYLFDPIDTLTVPMCLKTCGDALGPNSSGPYIYAAVENSRECFCGLTLSPLAKKVADGYCSSPCSSDTTTICGGYGYLTLYQRRSSLSGINATSTSAPTTSTTSSTSTSTPSLTPVPVIDISPSKARSRHSKGFWVGISIGIVLFILVLALIFYMIRRRAARRARALSTAGLSTDTSFLGGFALMHPSQKRQRPPINAVYTEDGRRFGVVVDETAADSGSYVSPLEGSPYSGVRNRPMFEEWKTGIASPLPTHVIAPAPPRVPSSPSAIKVSVELDSITSPGGHSDTGAVTGGDLKGGQRTPIAELADSRIPVSLESKERGSIDSDTVKDTRTRLDERELERRLKELGGLSPVSEMSGFETRAH
ncbi:hypothetical protein ONS95_002765 [Cadophora gregata]|uniref:uncharacterized protein n=1 Tax=Cadophora gregata TaxID=51156 RepID=UPI0026DAC6C8|nr:uncharacterized protein ONS95_002765 [Cadophora gregata]KAK0110110.1 hypothetical protein ONS95_002765 [Cadophora gregata]